MTVLDIIERIMAALGLMAVPIAMMALVVSLINNRR